MPGTARLQCAISKFRPIHSSKGRWVGTITPKKQTIEDAGEAGVEKEKAEPIVAFSRPPQFPPVIGPLVALSLLESWSKRDSNDE